MIPSPETLERMTLTLDPREQQFQEILETASYREAHTQKAYTAVVREVLKFGPNKEKVIFELLNLQEKPSLWKIWWNAIRGPSLMVVIGPFFALLSFGILYGYSYSLFPASFSLLGVLCLLMAVNLFNDVSDYKKLIDLPGSSRGSGVLHKGWLSLKQLRRAGYLTLMFGIFFGSLVLSTAPRPIFGLGLFGIIGVFFYSQEGFGLKYLGLSDLLVFFLLGPCLVAGYSYATFQTLLPGIAWLGSFFGLVAWGILVANNLQNMPLDSHRKVITLPNLLGFHRARFLLPFIYLLLGTLFLSAFFWAKFSLYFLASFGLCSFLGWPLSKKSLQASGPNSPFLNDLKKQTLQFHSFFSVAFSTNCLLIHLFS